VRLFEALEARARLADLPEPAIEALPALAERVRSRIGEAVLAPLSEALAEEPPERAVARVKAAELEARFGVLEAREAYLLLVLGQTEAACARHAREGIDAQVSQNTLADVGIWVRHFLVQLGATALTFEILDWSQRYLRGELVRLGALQFDLRPFGGPIAIDRGPDGGLSLVWLEGGRDADRVDPRTGRRTGEPYASAPGAVRVLDPSMPVLDMHIPAGTRLGLAELAYAIRDARAFFAARRPEVTPVGAGGEAWLLDPQMKALLPTNAGLHAVIDACALYPSKLREEKTIRRLFGPDVDRAMLPLLPRALMTSLHRRVVDWLADPAHTLEARGGFILWPEHDRILEALSREER
jgi:hypothetical protein